MCWQGISPGRTHILDVSRLLTDSGLNFQFSPGEYRNAIPVEGPHGWLKAFMVPNFAGFSRDPRIEIVCLRDEDQTGGLILADVLRELGAPDDLLAEGTYSDEIRLTVRYRQRLLEVSFLVKRAAKRLTLFEPIEYACFESQAAYPAHSAMDLPWRGSTSLYRYPPAVTIP